MLLSQRFILWLYSVIGGFGLDEFVLADVVRQVSLLGERVFLQACELIPSHHE